MGFPIQAFSLAFRHHVNWGDESVRAGQQSTASGPTPFSRKTGFYREGFPALCNPSKLPAYVLFHPFNCSRCPTFRGSVSLFSMPVSGRSTKMILLPAVMRTLCHRP